MKGGKKLNEVLKMERFMIRVHLLFYRKFTLDNIVILKSMAVWLFLAKSFRTCSQLWSGKRTGKMLPTASDPLWMLQILIVFFF